MALDRLQPHGIGSSPATTVKSPMAGVLSAVDLVIFTT